MGADLSLERLIAAYQRGIFPWFSEGDPILWWSPDPRMVLATAQFKLSRSLAKKCRQIAKQEQAPDARIQIRTDTCFGDVIRHCSHTRAEQGTWITQDIIDAYVRMHEAGYAHSVETWVEGQLVGGLYGICMGRFFFGESMFALQTDASKIALYYLVQFLRANHVPYIDCQQETAHLASPGAAAMPRQTLYNYCNRGNVIPPPHGTVANCWTVVCYVQNVRVLHPRAPYDARARPHYSASAVLYHCPLPLQLLGRSTSQV